MKYIIALCALALCGGCVTVEQVQDIIGGGVTNLPPAVTNALPTVPPIVLPPAQPANGACACDHSLPLCPDDIRTVYDRVKGAGAHQGAGNDEVCWSAQSGQGYDIRCLFRWAGPRQRHVSSWGRKWGYDVVSRGNLSAKCFVFEWGGTRYQCHYLGYSTEEDQDIEYPAERAIVCKGRTFAFWTVRVVGGSTVTPPAVTPPVAPPTIADMPVPERLGKDAYSGNGTGGTFHEVPGSAGWNPSKAVSMEAWVYLNGWARTDEGVMIIGKGHVGVTWAYALKIRPGTLLYQQTKGSVYATHKWRVNEWHHVRCEADKSGVRFWVDGKNVPVTGYIEVQTFLGSNEDPVRVGGQWMHWEPSAWYNASIDGTVSDWKVVVK